VALPNDSPIQAKVAQFAPKSLAQFAPFYTLLKMQQSPDITELSLSPEIG
jgi:hypothetical protein